MSLLIYFPGGAHGRRDVGIFEACGLGALVDRGDVRRRDRKLLEIKTYEVGFCDVLDHGPDDGGGLLAGIDADFLAYDPRSQEWFAGPAEGEAKPRYWIGWNKHRPPTPQTLERREPTPGPGLVLADGNEWLVPCVLDLPRSIGFDDRGRVVTKDIVPKHRPYAEAAEAMLAKFITAREAGDGVPREAAVDFAVLALQQNYRVTREVVLARELFTTQTLWDVVDLANGVSRRAVEGLRLLEENGIEIETPAATVG